MSKEMFSLKVWYHGTPSSAIDTAVVFAAAPVLPWAQGYDFNEDVRDIRINFSTQIEREQFVTKIESAGLEGVRTELR